MRKVVGIRLRRKLIRVWKWVFRRRRCNRGPYLRLLPTKASPIGDHRGNGSGPKVGRILDWGRCLTRRLCPSLRLGGGRGGYHNLSDGGGGGGQILPALEDHVAKPPKGHLVVYVGEKDVEQPPHRYVVPVIYFNHPLFGQLLREAEQEYGFHHPGGITIPCPVSDFENVRTQIAAGADGANCRPSAGMRYRRRLR